MYENRNGDIYSNGEMTVLKKISKFNPEIVIDGGANVGQYSLITQSRLIPGCKIYAFEPAGSTYNKLAGNISGNKKITPVMKGIIPLRIVLLK
ncbi:MAG: hypothetical protein MZV63_29175 [Marinilabiliales bacterium]|nr:hypothetical protein [Marinilabiliales bacterium]